MPISRYEIRNEYSLADPDLYRAADKDDPEALLEGVAMAGLVGVLRQLGDLAEFAADVFHNLHEEVMATAARGHGLMIRVQQLETEVPSIERAFLSQTDHSSFFYHGGVDWHRSPHIDQNVVTQGDLPRFVMDSYEECRAPPRLFLLDKFDVAGAGACLKRYTDPSFFKVEPSTMTRSDVQREKKIRKAKKKGPRWRNGETPEVLPTSHAKLHQLFLEEPVENGASKPSRHAKLKRRLNGFSFESKTGRSYMEKLLRSPTPDHKVLPEITVNSPPLMLTTTEHNESGLEIRPVSPERESVGSKRSPPSSPDMEEIMLDRSMYEPSEVPGDDKICEVSNSFPSIARDDISSSLNEVSGERVIAMDTESNREGSLTGYQSDDIASEVDNYVDAPSTMDSEMDTDSEMRGKSDLTSSRTKNRTLISDAYEEHFHTQSPDSQSTGDSTISDKGNNSSRNGMSSFSSGSLSTTAENPQPEGNFAKEFGSSDIHESERVDASSYQRTNDEDFLADQNSKPGFADDTCIGRNVITNYGLDFELPTSSLCSNESVPSSVHSDLEGVGRKGMPIGQELDETVSTLDDKENKTNLVMDTPCSPSVPDFQPQSRDDSPRSSAGENLSDERNEEQVPCISTVPDSCSHTTDTLVEKSLDLLHVDESGNKDHNLVENIPSTLDIYSQNTNGTPGMIFSRDLIPSQLDDEIPELPENVSSDHRDRPHNKNNIKSTVSKGGSVRTHVLSRTRGLTDNLGNEDSNVSVESPNHFPMAHRQTENAEDYQSSSSLDSQISSENPILLHLTNSPELPWTGVDAHVGDVIPDEETILSESIVLETPNDSEALENSCTQEHLEQPAGTSDTAEADAITMCMSSTEQEVNEIAGSSDLKSMYEAHVLMEESDSEVPKSNTEDMVCAVPTISGDVIIDNVESPVGINRSVEEHIQCFDDTGLGELEYDMNCHPGSYEESGPVGKMNQIEASTSGFGSVFCNTVNDDNPKTEVSDGVPSSHLDLEDDRSVVHAATSQLPVDQILLDREEENFQQNGLGNHVADTTSLQVDCTSLQVDCDSEESVIQERIGIPCSQSGQESLQTAEISSDLSPLQSVNHQQMPDHSDHEVRNTSPFWLVDHQNPPSVSELHNGDSGYHNNLFTSIFPPSNPFSATNHINLADSPQLPPLPPVQWRMRKLERSSSSTEGQIMKHEESFPQLNYPMTISTNDVSFSLPTLSADDVGSFPPISSSNDVSSSPLPTLSTDDARSFPPKSSINDVSSFPLPTLPSDEVDLSPPTSSNNDVSIFPLPILSTDDVGSLPPTLSTSNVGSFPQPTLSTDDVSSSPVKASTNDAGFSPPTTSIDDVGSSSSRTSIEDVGSSPPTTSVDHVGSSPMKASSVDVGSFPPTTSIDADGSSPPITSVNDATSVEEMKPSQIQISAEPSSEEDKTKTSCSNSEAEIMHETIDLPPKIENKHQQIVMPTSESESPSPVEEDGVANGSRTVKLPRPRNPLVEDVAALDKSKLRKVTERVMPQIQKVDERDSLLEQIRAKSFNLKPAVASRPSIRGPNTNLKVAAILEKANAIRQAFAGSDEDDDDSWSDS